MVSKNFKVWDQDNSVPKVEKKLTVSIRKDRVVFLVEARNALKIGVGQDVTFVQDTDDPMVLFLVRGGQNAMKVATDKSKNLLFVKAPLMCEEIFRLVKATRAFRVRISSVAEAFPKSPNLPAAGMRMYLNEVKLK